MRFLSVCSGIEAASVAWRPLGWQTAGVSEIEAFPRAVLEHRLGGVPVNYDSHVWSEGQNFTSLFGDFTQIEAHHVGPIDLLVGGTPCQSFSIAGLRGGLDDDRGNLALEFLRLADRTCPRWLVWENVPGVLSSNGGRDFGAILGGMAELGYGFAYRVLDAQFFGVPQRRRRVFVVGYLGDWRRAAAVLFERHSLSGHPAPRRKKGPPVAALTANGVGTCGADDNPGQAGHLIGWPATTAPTLNAAFGSKQGLEDQHIRGADYSFPQISHCLNAGGMGRQDYETETLIPTTGVGFDVAPVPFNTTQITSAANFSNPKPGDPCHPLARGAHAPAIAFDTARTLTRRYDGSPCADRGLDIVAYASAVRRLTPVECERLQGFPDNFTAIPWRGKPADQCPDGLRYKALGNSMAVPVMAWIGQRIAAVDAISKESKIA